MEATDTPARPGPVVALLSVAVAAAGAAGALVLAGVPRVAGVAVAVAGGALLPAELAAGGRGTPRLRFAVSLAARVVDAAVLGPLAWALFEVSTSAGVAALVALSTAFVAAYLRVKGAGMGFDMPAVPAFQSLRLAAVAVALLTVLGEGAVWAAAAIGAAEASVHAARLTRQREPA